MTPSKTLSKENVIRAPNGVSRPSRHPRERPALARADDHLAPALDEEWADWSAVKDRFSAFIDDHLCAHHALLHRGGEAPPPGDR